VILSRVVIGGRVDGPAHPERDDDCGDEHRGNGAETGDALPRALLAIHGARDARPHAIGVHGDVQTFRQQRAQPSPALQFRSAGGALGHMAQDDVIGLDREFLGEIRVHHLAHVLAVQVHDRTLRCADRSISLRTRVDDSGA
jgi:hypothetical protein